MLERGEVGVSPHCRDCHMRPCGSAMRSATGLGANASVWCMITLTCALFFRIIWVENFIKSITGRPPWIRSAPFDRRGWFTNSSSSMVNSTTYTLG